MGCIPAAQQPMCSRTCNEISYGHQMAISLHRQELLDGGRTQCLEELMNGSCIQHLGESKRGSEGTGDVKCSYTNVGPEESRRHCEGAINAKWSYGNVEPGINDDKGNHLPTEFVNKQWTAYYMLSLTNKTGYTPVVQWPKRSKMHNKHEPSPQMAVDLHHQEMMSSSGIQQIEGSRGGSCTQQGGGVGNRIHLN
jgi:hypothetical protein